MRKKHPIRNFFILLLIAAIVAGLAALPMLTAGSGDDENKASILAGTPQRRTLSRKIYSGGALVSQEPEAVSVPQEVQITRLLVNTGDTVHAGDPVAEVDALSVMNAVKSVQETLDTLTKDLQTVKAKITPGVITVNDSGKLTVNGKEIASDKLSYYTQFAELSEQHREYEELLLELFQLRQNGVVTAPCDGIVGSLDKTVVKPLSASHGGSLVPLGLNTPDGDDYKLYTCYAQQIVGFTEDGYWRVRWGRYASYIRDFLETGDLDITLAEEVEEWEPETVFAYSNGIWNFYTPVRGDILMYALDSAGDYWVIFVGNRSVEDPDDPDDPEEPDDPEDPENPDDPENPSDPDDPENPDDPGGGNGHGGGSGGFDFGSLGGLLGGMGGSRSGAGSQASSLYTTAKTTLCTVTPVETMQLTLPIDEADITGLEIGMTAEITLEALPNRKFTAVITDVSKFGLNSGGSSKFDVTLEVPCSDGMLPGMNANVSLELESVDNCITVPVAALVDQGSKTVIYTGRDEKNGSLVNPVPLTLGISDGEYVQVLAGITENTSFWYSYYDTLEISTAVETRGMFG